MRLPERSEFTRRVFASSSEVDFDLLVRPDDDLDGTFEAFDLDAREWLNINGWLFIIEDTPELGRAN